MPAKVAWPQKRAYRWPVLCCHVATVCPTGSAASEALMFLSVQSQSQATPYLATAPGIPLGNVVEEPHGRLCSVHIS